VAAEPGQSVAIDIRGASGGQWTLSRQEQGWRLWRGEPLSATARIRLNDETAWKLLFNALADGDAARAVHIEGRTELACAILRARSVIV
jgi:hypothetical protein